MLLHRVTVKTGAVPWLQARVFNAGEKRRTKLGAGQANDFFDASNSSSATLRDAIAMETLDELLVWVSGPGAHRDS